MTADGPLRPVCFMIMPFRTKVIEGARPGAPPEVDFDALWDKAYASAIEAAGYLPARADFDSGQVIVKDMLERLAFADLVLADVSLPNGNVYYEVGLRHVARNTGCVLFAADWSRQLFDIDQFVTVRYSLGDGAVSDAEAAAISTVVTNAIGAMRDSTTPWYEFITGVEDAHRRGVFRDQARRLASFQAAVRSARLEPPGDGRAARVRALLAETPESALQIAEVALELLLLTRDSLGWQPTLDFIERLPEVIARLPTVREQHCLAVAKVGESTVAIAELEALIAEFGETPERHGLIGGRYKALWRDAREPGREQPSALERRYLDLAIAAYERGMRLDLNAYFCSGNLAQLLIARDRDGDAARARVTDQFVVEAASRAIALGLDDEWTRPTLLGAAFRAGDAERVSSLVQDITAADAVGWQLEATLGDLREAVVRHAGTDSAPLLGDALAQLEQLL